jgi:hypothetical protein
MRWALTKSANAMKKSFCTTIPGVITQLCAQSCPSNRKNDGLLKPWRSKDNEKNKHLVLLLVLYSSHDEFAMLSIGSRW